MNGTILQSLWDAMIYCRMVEQVNDQSVLQMLCSTVAKEFEERRKEKNSVA